MEKEKEKPKRSLRRRIFNGIIGFFAGLVILFVLLIGFSQTYTFREFLRKKIISEFNSSTGGILNIRKIEGTLLTTLTVHDAVITIDKDTLFASKKIKLFISPLQLFLNKLYIREFQADNLLIALLEDSNNNWNISKLSKDTDTTKTDSFINSFQVNNIDVKELRFVRKTYNNYASNNIYDILNFDDLDVRDINFRGSVAGNINDNDYTLILNNLSLRPNLNKFTIKKISGDLMVNTKYAMARNLRIETDSTDINLTARLDSMNIFAGITLENFRNYPAQIQLDVKSFWFDDLSSFLEATDILKGRPSLKITADGKFGDINIRQLKLKYLNTSFEIKGKLLKLNYPEEMYIDAELQSPEISYNDVLELLPKFSLPQFKDLVMKNLKGDFKGEPTKFVSKLSAEVEDGKINIEGLLNLKPELMEYDVKLETDKINFKSVTGFDSEINSSITLKGKGVNPGNLESQLNAQILNSKIQDNVVHDFKITANGSAGNIIVDFNTAINNLKGTISGSLNFNDSETPKYNFAGRFNSVNLYQFTADSTLDSRLNFGIFAQGEKFDLDNMLSDITINLDSSLFNNRGIPRSQLRLLIDTEKEKKKIDLMSPFVDMTFTGNFSLNKAVKLLAYELVTIKDVITQKVDELNPLSVVQDSEIAIDDEKVIPDIAKYPLDIDYVFSFKDLNAFSLLLKSRRLDLFGKGKGKIHNDSANFSISTNLQVDNFVRLNGSTPVYIADLNADFKFSRNNNDLSFNNLFGLISISADRFYLSKDIRKIKADITFNQSKLFFNTSAVYDSLWQTEFEGTASFSAQAQEIVFDRVLLNNQDIEWTNAKPFYLSFAQDHFQLNGLSLKNKNSEIALSGQIFNVGYLNGDIVLTNISINEVNKMFPDLKNPFNGFLDLNAKIEGKLSEPVIKASVNINDIAIKDKKTGNLFCAFNYANQSITTSLILLDSLNNRQDPILTLSGSIPVDLSLSNVEKRLVDTKEIDLKMRSKKFDINNLGDIFPLVFNQQGLMESDIKIQGSFSDPDYSGFIRVKDGRVTGRMNNMLYDCGLKILLNDKEIRIDSMLVKNSKDSKYIGTITGNGQIELDGFNLDKINVTMNGDIAVYGERSRSINQAFYGDLFVASDGNWSFKYDKGKSDFTGNVLLKQTDLTYTTGQNADSRVNSGNVNFIYLSDPKKIDPKENEFRRIIEVQNTNKKEELQTKSTFDYNISVRTVNDANIMFIFSNMANKTLTVRSNGTMNFKSGSGLQGRLLLLPGSNLDFFKKFDATGSVLFENDITNPNLNVTATYQSEYTPPGSEQTPYILEVEMQLNGTLDQLATNLAKKEGKFKINRIQGIQGKLEVARTNDNDAISFILTGKLKDDLTQGEKSNLASSLSNSVTTSLVGSILTNFLNSALGDVVKEARFDPNHPDRLLVGGYILPNLKYDIGGSTQALQDLRYMDVKLEYDLPFNIKVRYQRKDPVLRSTLLEKKIDEIALKLRFVF